MLYLGSINVRFAELLECNLGGNVLAGRKDVLAEFKLIYDIVFDIVLKRK